MYVIMTVLVIILIKQHQQIEEQADSIAIYRASLSNANDSIEEANSIIEEAQSYAWSSYEEMGYALENLYTVSESLNPWR